MKHPPAGKTADHVNLTMGEIEHAQNAINHLIADGNEGINTAQRQAVDQLLGQLLEVYIHFTLKRITRKQIFMKEIKK